MIKWQRFKKLNDDIAVLLSPEILNPIKRTWLVSMYLTVWAGCFEYKI
jgi:hypothetical protein